MKSFTRIVEASPSGHNRLAAPWENIKDWVEEFVEPDYTTRVGESVDFSGEFWVLFTSRDDGTWLAECPTLGVAAEIPAKDENRHPNCFADAEIAIRHAICKRLEEMVDANTLFTNLRAKGF